MNQQRLVHGSAALQALALALVVLRVLVRRQVLQVDGVDQLPARRANVHALVLRNVAPVPPLGGKLERVPLGILLQLVPVAPYARLDPIAVLVPRWDRNNFNIILEGNFRVLFGRRGRRQSVGMASRMRRWRRWRGSRGGEVVIL